MSLRNLLFFSVSIACLFAYSCNKHNSNPRPLGTPPPTDTTITTTVGTMNINLTLLDPGGNASPVFTNYPNNGAFSTEFFPTLNSARVTFQNYPGNYAYWLFPGAGLYKLHIQQNAVDTVDCTHMDTVISLVFPRPVVFSIIPRYSQFIGIFDTTDLTKVIAFADSAQAYGLIGVDFQYPNIPVQKYEMSFVAFYNGSSLDTLHYYGYSNSVPSSMPFPSLLGIGLPNTQADDFSLSYPNNKPSYYQVFLSNALINYSLWVNPDSSTVHPRTSKGLALVTILHTLPILPRFKPDT
jgi:hypothetical protein